MSILRTWVCDFAGCNKQEPSYNVPESWVAYFTDEGTAYEPDRSYCKDHAELVEPKA